MGKKDGGEFALTRRKNVNITLRKQHVFVEN